MKLYIISLILIAFVSSALLLAEPTPLEVKIHLAEILSELQPIKRTDNSDFMSRIADFFNNLGRNVDDSGRIIFFVM